MTTIIIAEIAVLMRISQTLLWGSVSIITVYVVIVLLIYFLQAKMVYFPQKEIVATPQIAGLPFEDIHFTAEDGVRLHGWYIPSDKAAPTILYCHGNAGNISGRLQTIQLLNRLGVNLLMFDYRGYGKSDGTPTEKGTYRDALAAWNYLTDERGIKPQDIVIMGRSLGGAVAAWLATRKEAGAAVIESTFTSAADLGADIYPWLPVRRLIKYKYPTKEIIQSIDEPLFMAHSRDDEVIPFEHGKSLFERAKQPKEFVALRGGHGSGFWESGTVYSNSLKEFLETYTTLNSKIED